LERWKAYITILMRNYQNHQEKICDNTCKDMSARILRIQRNLEDKLPDSK